MAGENFLTCRGKYLNGPLQRPPEGATRAPYVKITFLEGDGSGNTLNSITVGNKSAPTENTAVIKDFEYAAGDGFNANFTIHDQEGGSLVQFMENLVTDSKELELARVKVIFEWGWVTGYCNGRTGEPDPSAQHCGLPKSLVMNFANGKFMFTVTVTDLPNRMVEGRTKDTAGDDENPICFEDALRDLFTKAEGPKVKNVKFENKDGSEGICWQKKDCGECSPRGGKGTKSVWNYHNRDKLQAAYEMLRKNGVTINDRSCTLLYDSECSSNSIVVKESNKPVPGQLVEWKTAGVNSTGRTYIVNGAKESPVIEFNPKINWTFAALQAATGGEAGSMRPLSNDDGGEAPGDKRSDKGTLIKPYIKGIGSEISGAPNRATEDAEGERAEDETVQALTQHEKALNALAEPVSADLVLVGDPTLTRPLEVLGKFVGVIFVNPFHIRQTGGACGEWLTPASCNEILSNRAWQVKHITHKISPGSYQTILKLFLAVPGIDIEANDPLGGQGSNGWVPRPA